MFAIRASFHLRACFPIKTSFRLRTSAIPHGSLRVYPIRVGKFSTNFNKRNEDLLADMEPEDTQSDFPAANSLAGKIINLKKNYATNSQELKHVKEKVTEGFEHLRQDMKDGATRTDRELGMLHRDMKDGFQRSDRWMVLLFGTFVLKGGFDTAYSMGWIGKAKS